MSVMLISVGSDRGEQMSGGGGGGKCPTFAGAAERPGVFCWRCAACPPLPASSRASRAAARPPGLLISTR